MHNKTCKVTVVLQKNLIVLVVVVVVVVDIWFQTTVQPPLMATSLQQQLIFVMADLSIMVTSQQRQWPLKRVPNNQFFQRMTSETDEKVKNGHEI